MMLADGKWKQRKAVMARKGAGSAETRLALTRSVLSHIWTKIRPIPYPKEVPDGPGCKDSMDIK
jgi:hypothetical protein